MLLFWTDRSVQTFTFKLSIMNFKTILLPLMICMLIFGINFKVTSQTTVVVGQIQNGVPVLTISESQFNTSMASYFSGRTYSNLQLLSGTDTNGHYYYIKADALQASVTKPVVIILEPSGSNISFNSGSGCEMACTWSGDCTGCDQTVLEKCVSIRCLCNALLGGGGFGGGSSSISYPD